MVADAVLHAQESTADVAREAYLDEMILLVNAI
jgi:hypothetical protein